MNTTGSKDTMLIDFGEDLMYDDPPEYPDHELPLHSTRDLSPGTNVITALQTSSSRISASNPLINFTNSNHGSAHILTGNTGFESNLSSDGISRDWRQMEAGSPRNRSSSPELRHRQDILSSSPMSSPPQIFTSSPFFSSQSSTESNKAYKQESLGNMQGLSFSDRLTHEDISSFPGRPANTSPQLFLLPPESLESSSAHGDRRDAEPLGESGATPNFCTEVNLPSSASSQDVFGEGVKNEDDVVQSTTVAANQSQSQQDAWECSPHKGRQSPPEKKRDIDVQEDSSLITPLYSQHRCHDPESGALRSFSSTNAESNESNDMVARISQQEDKLKTENVKAIMASKDNALEKDGWNTSSILGKRRRSISGVELEVAGPSTRRPKVELFRKQEKKLSTPFRAPGMLKIEAEIWNSQFPKVLPVGTGEKVANASEHLHSKASPKNSPDIKERHRTKRASLQFKSPLLSKPASGPTLRLTPTLQGLESKLQHLKRAVKIKEESDADILKGLIMKWTEAGREVAWEVWDLVKGSAGQDWGTEGSGNLKNSWGWAEDDGRATGHYGQGAEEETCPPGTEDVENEDKQEDTLGTMLHQLGIAHGTLGWNEEEGTFHDG